MGRIGQLILFTEEVMDEVYPHLSEADREFVAEFRNELDDAITEFYIGEYTVEEAAQAVLAQVRGMQYDAYWNARESWLEAQWEAKVS